MSKALILAILAVIAAVALCNYSYDFEDVVSQGYENENEFFPSENLDDAYDESDVETLSWQPYVIISSLNLIQPHKIR